MIKSIQKSGPSKTKKYFSIIAAIFGFAIFVSLQPAMATHIRAGEIRAELISCASYSYRFTVVLYVDTDGIEPGHGTLDFGHGETFQLDVTGYDQKVDLGDKIELNTFVVEHSFPGPGKYTVSFREQNRNAGILNIGNSVNTAFYIETQVVIDPGIQCNNSALMEIPPVDRACTGNAFLHNPGAFDPDGDSLSYKIVINKMDRDTQVAGYKFPNDPSFGGSQEGTEEAAEFFIQNDGTLVWNSPGTAGEYNLAFIVEEWREVEPGRFIQMGYVTRDMQVIVDDCENNEPEIDVPNDTCIVAGSLLEATISATDPENDPVKLEVFSEIFSYVSSPASFSPNPPVFQPSPAEMDVTWQTTCNHIRQTPYQVNIKATDDPPDNITSLANFEVWNIQVVGPPPQVLGASANSSRGIQLQWEKYSCSNAEKIQIWRRVGSFEYTPENCETGIPEFAGYELVAEVDAGVVSYLDDNEGDGLNYGAEYCYRLVAVFPEPEGGESIVSEEICAIIEAEAPVITNVSIERTDRTQGEIFVRWTSPFDIDQNLFPPPYTYEVVRATGLSGNNNSTVVTRTSDTTFVDTGLNTEINAYNYRIYLYDRDDNFVDSSAVASSVRLDITPLVGALELNWQADVPWSNTTTEYPYHYIYRNKVDANPSDLVLIDSVMVASGGFVYLDNGSFNGEPLSDQEEYCYFVETYGRYGYEKILEPLINKSQVACATPNDTIPPCDPIQVSIANINGPEACELFLADKPCDFNEFYNEISWEANIEGDCDDDIRGYRIYGSRTGEEGTYEVLTTVNQTFFRHEDINSFAYCYRISVVDRSGNESELSEPICNDNCPQYKLPNVFTPNGDMENEVFRAIDRSPECPRFVEDIHFKVYNRWGDQVYDSEDATESSIYINWNGKNQDGVLLTPGVYYYVADVVFTTLNPRRTTTQIKGWVQLLY